MSELSKILEGKTRINDLSDEKKSEITRELAGRLLPMIESWKLNRTGKIEEIPGESQAKQNLIFALNEFLKKTGG